MAKKNANPANNKFKPTPKNVLMLIHMEGKPTMTDEYSEALRWSTLRKVVFESKKRMVILSDHHRNFDHKMNEFRKVVEEAGIHKWVNIDPVKFDSILEIEKLLWDVQTIAKNVIFGGTNTKGCILDATPYSALAWAREGHQVKVLLDMCTEYQAEGVTQMERNNVAFSEFWRKAKEAGVVENIDFVTDLARIND